MGLQNLVVLRLSVAAYHLSRVICVDGVCSRHVQAARGITAGSGFATTELRLLLHDVVLALMQRWPLLQVTLYVDDLSLSACGQYSSVRNTVSRAAEHSFCSRGWSWSFLARSRMWCAVDSSWPGGLRPERVANLSLGGRLSFSGLPPPEVGRGRAGLLG